MDLSGDLDEEPSTAPPGNSKDNGNFSGMCRILHTLLSIENTPADLPNERKLTNFLSTVEVYGRSGKMPVPYVEAAISHLIGLLHIRFSPIWISVQSAIVSLIMGCDKYAWPHFHNKLATLMFETQNEPTDDKQDFLFFNGSHLLKLFNQWDVTGGASVSMFRRSVAAEEDMGRVSRHLFRGPDDVVLSAWAALEKQPQLIVTHSRDIVPLVLKFLFLHFYRERDPDAIEMNLRSHVEFDLPE